MRRMMLCVYMLSLEGQDQISLAVSHHIALQNNNTTEQSLELF